MILSDFPQEIIEKITDFLPIKDKASCSLVCKAWRRLFQDSLYSDISIESGEALSDIITPRQNNRHNYQETGHLARYLCTCFSLEITDENLLKLQNTFRNIKYIHFDLSYISLNNFGLTADWNIWRSLRELYISSSYQHTPDINNKLVKVIMCLPLLRRLDVTNTTWRFDRSAFSLSDFETIHSHLKHLAHLNLGTNLLTISDIDLERIDKLSPATHMGSLMIASRNMDYRWLYYFARKYPNLHKLCLSTADIISDAKEQKNSTISLLQRVPLPFQFLKELHLIHFGFVEKQLLFWDIINFQNISLKQISILIVLTPHTYSRTNLCDIPRRIAETCLLGFSRTIESFRLHCSNTCTTTIDIMEMKDNLFNLTELSIRTSTSVGIDILLCAAPCLKSLELYFTNIKVKDKLYNSKRFGLQSFKVSTSKVTSDVLRFLSFHCRNLNELDLTGSSVYGSCTTPGCQFIDMTYTRLATLYIYETEFIVQGNKERPENWNITLITRPVDDTPPKQDYDPRVSPVIIGGMPIKAHYHWFYAYKTRRMSKLSKSQGSRITKFVSNYEENKRITMERALQIKRRTPSDRWKESCIFGYTKIKLGYITNCKIQYSTKYN